MTAENVEAPTGGEVVVYEAPDGGARVEVVVGDETVWLTSRQMSDLFKTSARNVELQFRTRMRRVNSTRRQLRRNPS